MTLGNENAGCKAEGAGALPLAGRVYLHPEPPVGPHPGFRGPIRCDLLGVHVDEDCEWLFIKEEDSSGWPDSEWEMVERPQLIPWHRIDSIEWDLADSQPEKGSDQDG